MIIKSIVRKIIGALDTVYPKTNKLVFNSFPDYTDNPFSFFKFLMENEYYKKYKLVWLVDGDASRISQQITDSWQIYTVVEKKMSLRGIHHYLSAKKIFFSHGIYGDIPSYNRNKRINLWHGMPIKNIGALDSNLKNDQIGLDKLIVTSELFSDICSRAFNISRENAIILGQPRNDLLFQKTEYFKKAKIDLTPFGKSIVWLPTYLKSIVGDIRVDGNFEPTRLSILKLENFSKLNDFLLREKVLLIIKLHPMDYFNQVTFNYYTNIKVIKQNELSDLNEQLYPLIGSCDALLTDFSSVYVDYLILNKPIGFIIDDLKAYKETRGFVFKDVVDFLPGPIISNLKELQNFITSIKKEVDEFEQKRLEINTKFNHYSDSSNSERVAKYFLSS